MWEFNGRQYASRNSASTAAWKIANRAAWYASRDKANIRWPGKKKARKAVSNAIRDGRLLPAKMLPCFDCKGPAKMYDHFSYRWEYRFAVQAVCRLCSMARDKKKGRR